MKRFSISICIVFTLIAILISLLEYGHYVILGAPYGANYLSALNRHLPSGITPRFTEHAHHNVFSLYSAGHKELSSTLFFWQRSHEGIMAWRKDLTSYRIDPQSNSVILEVRTEIDTTGREQEWMYLNREQASLAKDTTYIQISCVKEASQYIYNEREVQPESISQWNDLDVTLISSNIIFIENIVWNKRSIRLRLIALLVLLMQALVIRSNILGPLSTDYFG